MNLRINANAIIKNKEDKLLLIKLKKGPFAGGLCIPGGGIEPGELAQDTVIREVLEETGIKLMDKPKPFGFCQLIHSASNSHRIVLLFSVDGEGIPLETEEGIGQWLSYNEAKDSLIEFAKESIRIWKNKENHFTLIDY